MSPSSPARAWMAATCLSVACASETPLVAESYLTPRPPAVPEVARAAYYAGFESVSWAEAETQLREVRHLWVEETQEGRVYLSLFLDGSERKITALVPRGRDVEVAIAEAKRADREKTVNHWRYQQLRWDDAAAMLRGEVEGERVVSVGVMHFGRVFLRTDEGAEYVAIEPTPYAVGPLIQGKDGLSVVVE